MINTVPDILARIVDHKAFELSQAGPLEPLEHRAELRTHTRRDFAVSLHSHHPAIIAEIKKASPSRGLLSKDFRPAATALEYQEGGAAAISVLTDQKFFEGSLADLESAWNSTGLPVLRKDFTTDPYHVIEAAAHGADAILLIAAILSERRLRDLRELAARYKMAALVEVHDGGELESAIASGAEIIGVNNRNLHTFEVTLETSLSLAARIPDSVLKVSESGFETREQIDRLRAAGFQAFLIGEHLMRSADPRKALQELTACS
ncbi:MAG: indole-3-glycerol phosphate synthase TrpC [Bryobacteraceae bacterium]